MSVTVKKVSIIATLFIVFGLLASCAGGGSTAQDKTLVFPEKEVATTETKEIEKTASAVIETNDESVVVDETLAVVSPVNTDADTLVVDNSESTSASQEVVSTIAKGEIVTTGDSVVAENVVPATTLTPAVVEVKSEIPVVTKNPGAFKDYSPEALANAKGDIILFFHAEWCGTCIALENKIIAGPLPDDFTILRVDYDDSKALQKKYGVRTQTTFVQVENNGDMIHRWVGGRDVADLHSRLK